MKTLLALLISIAFSNATHASETLYPYPPCDSQAWINGEFLKPDERVFMYFEKSLDVSKFKIMSNESWLGERISNLFTAFVSKVEASTSVIPRGSILEIAFIVHHDMKWVANTRANTAFHFGPTESNLDLGIASLGYAYFNNWGDENKMKVKRINRKFGVKMLCKAIETDEDTFLKITNLLLEDEYKKRHP